MARYRLEIAAVFFLIILTLAAYRQVQTHGFVCYDDNIYVTENPHVRAGWTGQGLVWAFTTNLDAHWHPVTWLSHMTDVQLFGLNPGPHHLTSLILHIVNTLLLFLILRRMTGTVFRSAFVAALFALHPLNVEPVSWVAGRKDLLCTFFWLLTMWAYVLYCERPTIRLYLLILLSYAMGLMAKPMAATLPLVMLLMDYWPLGRFRSRRPGEEQNLKGLQSYSAGRLIGEKLLLFVLLGASGFVAVSALLYRRSANMDLWRFLPDWETLGRAMVSYVSYMGKMFWPRHLAAAYPYSEATPLWQSVGAGSLMVFLSILSVYWAKKRPYILIGWLWYLVALVPVIGLLHVGPQNMGDRYTYIPLIGLFIIIAWGVPDALARLRYRRIVLGICAGLVICGIMILTWMQVRHWENSHTLFSHTIRVTRDNWLAHYNLGGVLFRQGHLKDAEYHFSEALRIRPDNEDAHNNLGNVYMQRGELDEAVRQYKAALKLSPDSAEFHNNLGVALDLQGGSKEAVIHFSEALRINPGLARVHNNLGNVLKRQNRIEKAIGHISEAVRLSPDNAEFHNSLGVALARQGDVKRANDEFSEALRIRPDYARAHYNLGNALREQGKPREAVRHLSEATRIKPENPEFHNNLGIALAQMGDFKSAIHHFSEAVRIRPGYRKGLENLELLLRIIDESAKHSKHQDMRQN
mgnify:CR=1 FL=1